MCRWRACDNLTLCRSVLCENAYSLDLNRDVQSSCTVLMNTQEDDTRKHTNILRPNCKLNSMCSRILSSWQNRLSDFLPRSIMGPYDKQLSEHHSISLSRLPTLPVGNASSLLQD